MLLSYYKKNLFRNSEQVLSRSYGEIAKKLDDVRNPFLTYQPIDTFHGKGIKPVDDWERHAIQKTVYSRELFFDFRDKVTCNQQGDLEPDADLQSIYQANPNGFSHGNILNFGNRNSLRRGSVSVGVPVLVFSSFLNDSILAIFTIVRNDFRFASFVMENLGFFSEQTTDFVTSFGKDGMGRAVGVDGCTLDVGSH